MSTFYTFREAADGQELYALLQLRYREFRNGGLGGFCPENEFGIDLDAHDLHARHFGFFRVDGRRQEAVGYLRVIQTEEGPLAEVIRNTLGALHEDFRRRLDTPPKASLPVIEYFPGGREVVRRLHAKVGGPHLICEGSRFSVTEGCRSIRLVKAFFESTMAFVYFYEGFQASLISCTLRHSRFYTKYGYEIAPGTQICDLKEKKKPSAVLLQLLAEDIPGEYQGKLRGMAEAYDLDGQICFYPEHPTYFRSPRQIVLGRKNGQVIFLSARNFRVRGS